METKVQARDLKNPKPAHAPQMQVRSNLRSGGDLETCLFNLNKWRERYYYWYDQAKKAGKI
ncbi:MAG: hypothetical protein JXA78_17065 [Anaerolineales bacterium]|nr:hypothetical protein [Anaerolineales bacterium]